MERLEQALARRRRSGPPDMGDSTFARLLSDLSIGVEVEVERHFAFEENHLFPYLEAMGDDAIGVHSTSEHAAMRPLWVRVAAIARAAAVKGFAPTEWEEFIRLGQELGDCMLAHVQKEEMALLPVIEETVLSPLNWSSLKYGFDQGGLDRWQGKDTQQKRLSRSYGRSMC
jgi:hemerythrin-like domain-containing protein